MKKLVRRSLIVTLLVTLMLTLTVSLTSAAGGGNSYHTVRYGETLFSIGRTYNVNPYVIADSNGLYNPDHIYAGQVLYIPSGSGYWDHCGRDCGNSWDKNNNRNNCRGNNCKDNSWDNSSWNNNKDWNKNNNWNQNNNRNNCRGNNCKDSGWDNANWRGGKNADIYIVRKGDTLYSIARRYGVSVWAIADANGIHNIDHIYYGQRLHIPSGGKYYY